MIVKLLKYLDEGNDFSDKAVQLNLGLSEFMAKRYKEQLIQGQYIKKMDGLGCSTSCDSCQTKCAYAGSMDTHLIMWEITDKGLNVIKKN